MATKLKNFSRHVLTKAVVFALSVLMVYCIVDNTAEFIYRNQNEDLSLMLESVFCDDFFETNSAENAILNGTLFVINNDLDSGWFPWDMAMLEYASVLPDGREYCSTADYSGIQNFKKGDYIVFKGRTITEAGGSLPQTLVNSVYYDNPSGAEFVIRFPSDYFGDDYKKFDRYNDIADGFISTLVCYFVIFLLCFVFLCGVTGREPNRGDTVTVFPDNIWTELHLCGLIAILCFCLIFTEEFIRSASFHVAYSQFNLVKILTAVLVCAVYALFTWISLSLIRKIKAKCFFKSTFIWWCWLKLSHMMSCIRVFFQEFIRNFTVSDFKDTHFAVTFHKMQVRYIVFSMFCAALAVLGIISALSVYSLFIFICVAIIVPVVWLLMSYFYLKKSRALAQSMTKLLIQIDKVSSGDLDYYAGLNDGDYLIESSDKLANIGEGLNEALTEQMKGERMKIELITNVSHDLKTPLTSIISYIDLLKKEELSDVAGDYVAILSQKADRLKGIVSDLFDLAKTNSGNIELDIKPLDFAKLTSQLLADMEDKINAVGLNVKTNLPLSPVVIRADGKKLSRALQNVVDNALKYSLAGSRIYIDLIKNDESAVLTVKNTASYEMDFTAEEISQRFVRGDKNRSTEGSGLGLSIAQSFTEVSGGEFKVLIDGDQFKTVFTFELCHEDIAVDSEEIV